jgi:hypothetical protein
LLNRRRQSLGVLLTFTIEQEGRECAFGYIGRVLLLDISLIVSFEGLLELHFLSMSFGMEKFSLETKGLLCDSGLPVDGASFTLPPVEYKPKIEKGAIEYALAFMVI